MGEEKHWHLVCYDIREPKRWAKAYRVLKGSGEHLQLSIFRVELTRTKLAKLRWRLGQILEKEDSLMIVRLCPGCAQRVIDSRDERGWDKTGPGFEVL